MRDFLPSLQYLFFLLSCFRARMSVNNISTTIFTNLLFQADDGLIQYPYSTREVVNIVKHLERFPDEGLGAVVRDVAYSHCY